MKLKELREVGLRLTMVPKIVVFPNARFEICELSNLRLILMIIGIANTDTFCEDLY